MAAQWDAIQKQVIVGNAFLAHSESTIGVEFGSRLVDVFEPVPGAPVAPPAEGAEEGALASAPTKGERKVVKLQLWDTAGQETFRSITRSYYRGAGGALLVFSLTNRRSFLDAEGWLNDLREFGDEGMVVLLVGNKKDEFDSSEDGSSAKREVEREEAEAWAREKGCEAGYVETSAKSGENVDKAFDTLTRVVYMREMEEMRKNREKKKAKGGFSLGGAGSGKKGGCC